MNRSLVLALLLVVGTGADAQVPGRAATQVSTPAPASPPAAQVVTSPQSAPPSAAVPAEPPGPAAAVVAAPTNDPKTEFAGTVPPVALTLVYPPEEGAKFTLATHNLVQADDGFYAPTSAANSFVMQIPTPVKDVPVSIACSVRGQPRSVGTLYWLYSNGAPGGGVDFGFPAGETETRYETKFGPEPYPFPMTSMWITLPPETALKQCRVSGTFEWASLKRE